MTDHNDQEFRMSCMRAVLGGEVSWREGLLADLKPSSIQQAVEEQKVVARSLLRLRSWERRRRAREEMYWQSVEMAERESPTQSQAVQRAVILMMVKLNVPRWRGCMVRRTKERRSEAQTCVMKRRLQWGEGLGDEIEGLGVRLRGTFRCKPNPHRGQVAIERRRARVR